MKLRKTHTHTDWNEIQSTLKIPLCNVVRAPFLLGVNDLALHLVQFHCGSVSYGDRFSLRIDATGKKRKHAHFIFSFCVIHWQSKIEPTNSYMTLLLNISFWTKRKSLESKKLFALLITTTMSEQLHTMWFMKWYWNSVYCMTFRLYHLFRSPIILFFVCLVNWTDERLKNWPSMRHISRFPATRHIFFTSLECFELLLCSNKSTNIPMRSENLLSFTCSMSRATVQDVLKCSIVLIESLIPPPSKLPGKFRLMVPLIPVLNRSIPV